MSNSYPTQETKNIFLKELCHEILDTRFFWMLTHLGPLFIAEMILHLVSI